jgi:hypothetical protein
MARRKEGLEIGIPIQNRALHINQQKISKTSPFAQVAGANKCHFYDVSRMDRDPGNTLRRMVAEMLPRHMAPLRTRTIQPPR